MNTEKHAEYIAKAKEAADRAARTDLPGEKIIWEKIAESYRELAQQPHRWP